jgi:hypothetical protein
MIGHYSASLVAKAIDPRLPLWVLFVAAQLVDIVWAVLIAANVEHVNLVEGFTASNPLDLAYMPYSHSLTATVGWAALAAIAWLWAQRRFGWRGSSLLVGAVVLSHWLLDALVHVPDLPLYGDQHKQGLGLWNHAPLSLALETALFFGALALYYRATAADGDRGRWGMLIMGLALFGVQVGTLFGPVPPSHLVLSATGMVSFIGLAVCAEWLDRKRRPRAI